MAHRVCNQTYIMLFIINRLVMCHFGKAVLKAVLSCKKELFDLASALRAKPVPPVADRFIAYIYSTLINQVFHISK